MIHLNGWVIKTVVLPDDPQWLQSFAGGTIIITIYGRSLIVGMHPTIL